MELTKRNQRDWPEVSDFDREIFEKEGHEILERWKPLLPQIDAAGLPRPNFGIMMMYGDPKQWFQKEVALRRKVKRANRRIRTRGAKVEERLIRRAMRRIATGRWPQWADDLTAEEAMKAALEWPDRMSHLWRNPNACTTAYWDASQVANDLVRLIEQKGGVAAWVQDCSELYEEEKVTVPRAAYLNRGAEIQYFPPLPPGTVPPEWDEDISPSRYTKGLILVAPQSGCPGDVYARYVTP